MGAKSELAGRFGLTERLVPCFAGALVVTVVYLFAFAPASFFAGGRLDAACVALARLVFFASLALPALLRLIAQRIAGRNAQQRGEGKNSHRFAGSFPTSLPACAASAGIFAVVVDLSGGCALGLTLLGAFASGFSMGVLAERFLSLLHRQCDGVSRSAQVAVILLTLALFASVSLAAAEVSREFWQLASLMPLASAALLSERGREPVEGSDAALAPAFSRAEDSSLLGALITSVTFGVMAGLMSRGIHSGGTATMVAMHASSLALAACALFAAGRYTAKTGRSGELRTAALLLVALGYLVASRLFFYQPFAGGALSGAGYIVLGAWGIERCRLSSPRYFDFSLGILVLACPAGIAAGYAIALALVGAAYVLDFVPAIEMAVVFCLLLASVAFGGRRRGEAESSTAPNEDRQPKEDFNLLVKDSCERVARAHNLSAREREVLFYLALGRDAAYIQDQLTLSIFTVRTHIRNIYKKLDAHNRQDILDLVQAAGEAPSQDNSDRP